MSHPAIHFYDAASPGNVPSGVYAAAYVNGFAWPEVEIRRMSHILRISVRPEAFWAKFASIIDVETGAASPDDVVPFIRERNAHGFNDAKAYVNRSNYDQVRSQVDAAGVRCLYWVATLDGTQQIEGSWAVQYQGGQNAPFDVSVLHGINDFHRP